MDKKMKKALMKAFEAPHSDKKEMFFEKLRLSDSEINFWQFLFYQIRYIRKSTWIASFVFLVFAYFFRCAIGRNSIWVIASLTPFIATIFLNENYRSYYWGMGELESVTRFSLKSIMLSRMAAVGVVHLILLCLFLPLIMGKVDVSVIRMSIYFLVPYLLATTSGFFITRYMKGMDGVYAFAGISFLICILELWLKNNVAVLFLESSFYVWIIAAIVIGAIGTVLYMRILECAKEATIWN